MGASAATRGLRPLVLLTWPLRHIRWKIILPYAFLTLVLAGVGSYLATNVVTGSLEERFANQLAEAGRVTADSVVRAERAHLEVVRSVAFTQGVADAVAAGDSERVARLAGPIAANSGIERLEVLDGEGSRLYAVSRTEDGEYTRISDGDDPATWYAVQAVLDGVVDSQGDKHAQLVETASGFVLYTAGPVKQGERTVGVVLAGTPVKTFLASAEQEALANVTLYDFNGFEVASTFALGEGADLQTAVDLRIEDPAIVDAVVSGEAVRETRTVLGREYDLVYSTLRLRNEAVGIYSVALPTDFIFSAGNTTRTQVALLFGAGIVAVLGIGLFLAHRMTQPILRLVITARRVAGGDLTARSGIRTGDEIGALAASFDQMTARLQRQHLATIKALTSAIDARDPYTLGHSLRVGQLAVLIGKQLRLDRTLLGHLETGGYLHDIGKIGIRDHILLKPGSLTAEERAIINEHPRIGLQILEPVELPPEVIAFVAGHHERLDGSGYPAGLREDEVPLVARVAAVSDMYDALTTDRPYRAAMSPEQAMAILKAESGSCLDADVVWALRDCLEEWERRRRLDPELQGFKLVLPADVKA